MKPGLRCWVTCLAAGCGHHENVAKQELNRAKRYRCCRCGGPVEMSKAARELVATRNDAAAFAAQRKKDQTGEAA